ncbi:hypothetical protein PVK06_037430 [Gossypium arboreum]|uniref:Uncharacterized protein n=1 Tax=Gossypium arboreum TaxID=29729 RepID=A0ABR0MZ60_GOSAR|nr:hypothetical protein PVK06_037430 [Gossypium arboreum]
MFLWSLLSTQNKALLANLNDGAERKNLWKHSMEIQKINVQILLEIRVYPMILKTSETVLGSWMCMITLIMVHFSHGIIIKRIIHWQGSLIQHWHKLKRVKKVLGKMNLECYSAISRRGSKILYKEYRSLLEAEECHFRQKSRVLWLKEADSSTMFFIE